LSTSLASEPVRKEVLENGITVLVKEVDENIAAIEVFVKAGVMNESKEKVGISRFLTAVLLRGTSKYNARDRNFKIESIGGVVQGDNNPDYAEYYALTTAKYFDIGLDLVSDLIQNPAFADEEIEKERKDVFLEIEKLQNKPFARLNDLFNATLFQRHPYGRPALGYRETIEKITKEDLINFYKSNYVGKNMVISIVGNINTDSVLQKVKNAFQDIPNTPPPQLNNPEEPKPLLWREDYKVYSSDTAYLFLGYLSPSIQSPDFPAMEVLQLIIGGGMNSRMWINFREKKGLAYDLGSFMSPSIGPGHMVTFIATSPGKVNEARRMILEDIKGIRDGKISNEEIEIMKTFRIGQYYINQETVKSQAFELGLYETLGVGYQYYLNYPDLIQKVTKDDIIKVANAYLTNHVMIILSPRRPNIESFRVK